MSTEPDTLDLALAEAHLPALAMAMVHLTGDAEFLSPQWRAAYDPFDPTAVPRLGGYSPDLQTTLLTRARTEIKAHLAGAKLPPAPPAETIIKMMDFLAGADIPRHYAPFLMDELGLGGVDTKTPHWESARLKQGAAQQHVIVIGAGMSGILAGIRLKQAGISFTILEKNTDVGGTWWENIYSGCRVDNPNHMYSYSFEPNHSFPQYYSTQPVLLDYFMNVVKKHDLRGHIRFGATVEEAAFDEASSGWRVTVTTPDGVSEILRGTALISAVGQLNRPSYPDIPGLESFAGPSFHSATWRKDVDLEGKRVAVIGTGASAYQFVPIIAPDAAKLDVFQRTPPWALPRPEYHHDVPDGKKWLMEHVPFYGKWYRFYLFWSLTDGVYDAVKSDAGWNGGPGAVSAANEMLRNMLAEAIRMQAPEQADLLAKVIPQYPFGGKRALVDNGSWLRALQRENVELVTTPIEKITASGVVTTDGVQHEADVLIFGTGFKASQFLWPMRIIGRGGVSLHEAWNGDARAYLGITTPGFPNLFILYGPNTNIVVNGSIVFFSECEVRYTIGCLALLAETGAATLEVKQDVHDDFNVRIDAANAGMAWGAPQVKSWYKNATGRVSQNWPFPLVDYWNATVAPKADDFVLGKAAESDAALVTHA